MIKGIESIIENGRKNIHLIQEQIKNCPDPNCDDGWITEKVKGYNLDGRHSCQYYNNKLTSQYKHEIINAISALNYINAKAFPEEYRKVFQDINKIKAMPGYSKFKDFFKSDKQILWIHGPVGTGKTTILIYLKIKSMLNLPECRLMLENEFKIKYGVLKTPEIMHRHLIDDVRNSTKHYTDFYYNLFNKIRSSNMKIAITSNYSPKVWCDKFENRDDASRIFDRMRGIVEVIEITGKSRR